jgi:hypothetical protein
MVATGPVGGPLADERELCRAWFAPELTDDDRAWLQAHLELAGRRPPHVDISWIRMETVRG